MSDEAIQLLRELVNEVRGLRAELTNSERPCTLSNRDRQSLMKLFPVVAAIQGSKDFTVRDLLVAAA